MVDKNSKIKSMHGKAMKAAFKGDLDISIDLLKNAIDIAREVGDNNIEFHLFISIAECQRGKGDYDLALNYFKKSLRFYKQIDDKTAIVDINSEIGITHAEIGTIDEAEIYLKKAILLAKEIGKNELKSENTLAEIFLKKGYLNKGFMYLKKLLKRSKEQNNLIGVYAINWSLSWYYLHDYNFEKALSCAKIAHKGFTDFEWENIVNRVNLVLGYIYYKKKKLKEAQMYIEFALDFFNGSSKIGNAYFKSVILLNIIKKQLGSKVEIDNEETLIKNKHSILDHDDYFLLYTLFDKDSYLKKAMEAINKIVKNLKEDEKKVFLNYSYIASINGKYNKVFNN